VAYGFGLRLGVSLCRDSVRAACQELAGDRDRVEVEDVPHVLQTEEA
jgi:hypothetical protein